MSSTDHTPEPRSGHESSAADRHLASEATPRERAADSDVYDFHEPPPAGNAPRARPESGSPALRRGGQPQAKSSTFWFLMGCNLLVFVSSMDIMVLELTASRLMAKHVGNSLYTWTSVIGVVLAGITVGNYLGGWLADRFAPKRILGWLFFSSSVFSFAILWLDPMIPALDRGDISWPMWVLSLVTGTFFLPSMALGTISPVVAALALSRRARTGITVGNVYAWGALGSIVGTFLCGFLLINAFGTKAIICITAASLAVMGVIVAGGQRAFRTAVVVGWLQFMFFTGLAATATSSRIAHVGGAMGQAFTAWSRLQGEELPTEKQDRLQRELQDWSAFGAQLGRDLHELGITLNLRHDRPGQYHDESNYSYINVGETVEDGETIKYLKLDKLIHSYYNPNNPTALYYQYEDVYAAVTEAAVAQWDRTTTVDLPEFPGRVNITGSLPDWIRFDEERQALLLRGGLTPHRRDELLALAPVVDYWKALEHLNRRTNLPDWEGGESIELDQWPEDAAVPDELVGTIRYDADLQLLTANKPITDADFRQLIAAAPYAEFYNAVDRLYGESRRVSTMFMGGGGFVFPRWIEAKFPKDPRIDVAELDPAVKRAVRRELGLPPDDQTAINTYIGDARNFVDDRLQANAKLQQDGRPPVLYDFIYADAFNDFSVPWHLTTREFEQKIEKLLKPEGVFLANIIDIYPRTSLGKTFADGGNPEPEPDKASPQEPGPQEGSGPPAFAFGGPVPAELLPDELNSIDWIPCPPPFGGLEIRPAFQDGNRFELAVRGRMSDGLRQRLLKLASDNPPLKKAVEALYRRSRRREAGRLLASYVKTAAEVFENVYVFSTEQDGPPSDVRDTFVMVCSQQRLNLSGLQKTRHWQGQPFAALETGETTDRSRLQGQMEVLLELSGGLVLTDNFAPVDNLLIPVVVRQE